MDIGGVHLPTVIGVTGGAGIAFTAVYGTFSRFEKIQSRKNRLYVSRWLLGLQVPKEGSEEFFIDLFYKLFGPRHWSIRCAITSFMLSASLILIAALGAYLHYWSALLIVDSTSDWSLQGQRLSSWIVAACLIDYLSLWKTRLILTRASALRSTLASLGFVAADFVITSALFCVVPFVMMCLLISTTMGFGVVLSALWNDWWNIATNYQYQMTVTALHSSFYLIALATSAWLWAYVIASQLVRLLAYIPPFIQFLSKIADVNEHPVRVLGFVAGVLSALIVGLAGLVFGDGL
jgi:hypothetical protein